MYKTAWSIGIASGLAIESMCTAESTTNTPPSTQSAWATNTLMVTQNFPSLRLHERWLQELIPSGHRIMYNRYDTPSEFLWIQSYDIYEYGIHDYAAEYGKRTVFKIMGSAAREAALKTLPVDEFVHDGENFSEVLKKFFVGFTYGSLANAEEEDSTAVSSTPTYSTLKHIIDFEWNQPSDAWSGQYGWRPWRDNPYAYLDLNLGHYCGRQFIRTEVRCYGYLRPNSFGVVKTEASAIITLSQKSQLVVGGFIYPFEDSPEYDKQGSIRFETYWRKSLISFGVASTPNGPFWNTCVDIFF